MLKSNKHLYMYKKILNGASNPGGGQTFTGLEAFPFSVKFSLIN